MCQHSPGSSKAVFPSVFLKAMKLSFPSNIRLLHHESPGFPTSDYSLLALSIPPGLPKCVCPGRVSPLGPPVSRFLSPGV
jgi:hypothetical protein